QFLAKTSLLLAPAQRSPRLDDQGRLPNSLRMMLPPRRGCPDRRHHMEVKMAFPKIAALLLLVCAAPAAFGCLANESNVNDTKDGPTTEIAEPWPWDFGCPFDQNKCSHHCKDVGRSGGYCGGTLKFTCICFH